MIFDVIYSLILDQQNAELSGVFSVIMGREAG